MLLHLFEVDGSTTMLGFSRPCNFSIYFCVVSRRYVNCEHDEFAHVKKNRLSFRRLLDNCQKFHLRVRHFPVIPLYCKPLYNPENIPAQPLSEEGGFVREKLSRLESFGTGLYHVAVQARAALLSRTWPSVQSTFELRSNQQFNIALMYTQL